MNDKLNNTKMLEESHKFKKNYETMLNDANTLSEKDFSDKYNEKEKFSGIKQFKISEETHKAELPQK